MLRDIVGDKLDGIIDFRGIIPVRSSLENFLAPSRDLGAALDRYAEKYHLASSAGELEERPQGLAARMDKLGIDHMLLAGLGSSNDEIANYVEQYPGRFSGIADISPRIGLREVVNEIQRVYSMGFRVVGLRPFVDGLRSSDRQYYPVYSMCAELHMAVIIHTSFNFGRGLKLDFGRPLHLDDVATDFPELTIIASHAGWPWVPEMIAVAWHHDNIYLELSGQRAKHMAKDGSGWEFIFNYGSGPLQSRLLWGSATPVLDLRQQLSETLKLPMNPEALSRMLSTNPRHLLTRLGIKLGSASLR